MKPIKIIIVLIGILGCIFFFEEAVVKTIATLIITVPLALSEWHKARKLKEYEEEAEEYQIADIENISDDIRGSCLYYACEKGDEELRRYLKGLVNSNVLTCEQGGKLFYEYAQKQSSRF